MPVSPCYCLVFDHTGTDGICDVSQVTVDMFNSRTLHHCDKTFVAASADLVVDWAALSRTDTGKNQ